jgi:hypothetical protein
VLAGGMGGAVVALAALLVIAVVLAMGGFQ